MAQFTEYAVAVGRPYPDELAQAQARVNHYLAHLSPARRAELANYEYLAVEATTMKVSDVQGLANQLASGRAQASSAYEHGLNDRTAATARFIMIFNPKTGQPATDEGFVAIDTPTKGKVGMFGGFSALFIGNGR